MYEIKRSKESEIIEMLTAGDKDHAEEKKKEVDKIKKLLEQITLRVSNVRKTAVTEKAEANRARAKARKDAIAKYAKKVIELENPRYAKNLTWARKCRNLVETSGCSSENL